MIIRARVFDLQSVPHFIVFSKTAGPDSDSWIVQCEILQHNLLGGGPPVEDLVPELPVGDGAPFAFFGLGQPGAGPDIQDQDQDQNAEDQGEDQGQNQEQNWDDQQV